MENFYLFTDEQIGWIVEGLNRLLLNDGKGYTLSTEQIDEIEEALDTIDKMLIHK